MTIIPQVYAVNEIINEALPSEITSKAPATSLAFYIAIIWKTFITIGSIAFIIYFVMGGIEWLTSGGDKTKVQEAQKRISSATIGLTILVGSYAIIYFVQSALKINILAPIFPNNL